jgi:hypothetical protein
MVAWPQALRVNNASDLSSLSYAAKSRLTDRSTEGQTS